MDRKNIAVVTGASSGLGKEFVLQLDKMNCFDEVWLISRSEEKMNIVKEQIKTSARILSLDLTKTEDLNKYKLQLEEEKPNITYLVNSAGFGKFGSYEEVDVDESLRMIDLNDKALVYITMVSLNYMEKGARIINLGSASSFFPLINFNIYASTKAFVVHYSNALHDELKSRGISVTAVCPGWVNTEFFKTALDDNKDNGPKKYKPMLNPSDVVTYALKKVKKGKKMAVYNWYTKFHRFGARFFPRALMLSFWKKLQKRSK